MEFRFLRTGKVSSISYKRTPAKKIYQKDTRKMRYIIFPEGTKIKYNFEIHILKIGYVGDFGIKEANNINIYSNNRVMITAKYIYTKYKY